MISLKMMLKFRQIDPIQYLFEYLKCLGLPGGHFKSFTGLDKATRGWAQAAALRHSKPQFEACVPE